MSHYVYRLLMMIDWLEFNGTFSTVRLYRAFNDTDDKQWINSTRPLQNIIYT